MGAILNNRGELSRGFWHRLLSVDNSKPHQNQAKCGRDNHGMPGRINVG